MDLKLQTLNFNIFQLEEISKIFNNLHVVLTFREILTGVALTWLSYMYRPMWFKTIKATKVITKAHRRVCLRTRCRPKSTTELSPIWPLSAETATQNKEQEAGEHPRSHRDNTHAVPRFWIIYKIETKCLSKDKLSLFGKLRRKWIEATCREGCYAQ